MSNIYRPVLFIIGKSHREAETYYLENKEKFDRDYIVVIVTCPDDFRGRFTNQFYILFKSAMYRDDIIDIKLMIKAREHTQILTGIGDL